jgi:hypothetical protein
MDWRLGAAYFESQLIDYDVCSNWGIGLIWQELEMIQGSTVISIFKNKRMIMIRIGVSVICGCSSFVSQRVTKLSKLFHYHNFVRALILFVFASLRYLFSLAEIVFTAWIKDYMFLKCVTNKGF